MTKIILLLFLSGCAYTSEQSVIQTQTWSQPKPTTNTIVLTDHSEHTRGFFSEETNVYNNVWRYTKKSVINKGFGLYNYVLTSRTEEDKIASARYHKLVAAITSSTSSFDELPEPTNLGQLNLFLIPGSKSIDEKGAKNLLTAISINSKHDFSGPGPYLFTMSGTIENSQDLVNMLYVDLSNTHEGAFNEMIDVYKKQVIDSKLVGIKSLKSFKISLLSSALVAEESISIVKAAKADILGNLE